MFRARQLEGSDTTWRNHEFLGRSWDAGIGHVLESIIPIGSN